MRVAPVWRAEIVLRGRAAASARACERRRMESMTKEVLCNVRAAHPSAASPRVPPSVAPSVTPAVAPSVTPAVTPSVTPTVTPAVAAAVASAVAAAPLLPPAAAAPRGRRRSGRRRRRRRRRGRRRRRRRRGSGRRRRRSPSLRVLALALVVAPGPLVAARAAQAHDLHVRNVSVRVRKRRGAASCAASRAATRAASRAASHCGPGPGRCASVQRARPQGAPQGGRPEGAARDRPAHGAHPPAR
jgi:hypothetical protein